VPRGAGKRGGDQVRGGGHLPSARRTGAGGAELGGAGAGRTSLGGANAGGTGASGVNAVGAGAGAGGANPGDAGAGRTSAGGVNAGDAGAGRISASGVNAGDAGGAGAGQVDAVGAEWAAAAEWASAAAFAGSTVPAPFPADQAPEVLGTAVVLHHLNRVVNLFLGPLPLPPGAPAASMVVVRRVLVRLIKAAERGGPVRGASLDLLPEADLPADLGWAGGDPVLADAFARAAGALDAAGRRSVPVGARELVLERLAAWDGRAPGVSRAWVEDAVSGLPPAERAAGRLALLTALAAYQVDDAAVAAFRAVDGEDRALVELTSWASTAAARRIGSWAPLP
ncbi:hypothetical protein, partial [Actinosynnema pretiosum]|uniref:hypothetical protein n=1 Tax=Actinosynnema pretiosum TaxID=42197 RepID=UPI0031E03295